MTSGSVMPYGGASPAYAAGGGREPANLGDILERVLDKGLVIAGDIRVNLLDIELLTIKLRLVIASLDTAREVGINWWESDPWLSADAAGKSDGRELEEENRRLRDHIAALESGQGNHDGASRRMGLRRLRRHGRERPRPAHWRPGRTGARHLSARADRSRRRCAARGVRRIRLAPQP